MLLCKAAIQLQPRPTLALVHAPSAMKVARAAFIAPLIHPTSTILSANSTKQIYSSRFSGFHSLRVVHLPAHRVRNPNFPSLRPLRRRVTPQCHASCHSACGSGGGSGDNEAATVNVSPITKVLQRIAVIRDNPIAAGSSAVCLSIAAALYVARLPYFLTRISLGGSIALSGVPAVADSVLRLIRTKGRSIDVDLLMSVAALICFFTGALFEGALLTTLYAVSNASEEFTSSRARRSLDALRDMTPTVALRLPSPKSSKAETVNVSDIIVGDFLLVRLGEILPCDGEVLQGAAFVSMQHITGESTPRHVEEGDLIPAGCKAEDAPIVVRVTKTGAETSMARIARLVTAAQENRPRVTKFFDRFGQRYTRTVFALSFVLALSLPLFSRLLHPVIPLIPYVGRSGSLARALGFLVAASPCALVIGGPVAYLAALSASARRGILAKSGAKSLEAASRVSHIVFDKTGTLTTGNLTLTSVAVLPVWSKESETGQNAFRTLERDRTGYLGKLQELDQQVMSKVVSAAAALEKGAVHPIATALQRRAEQLGTPLPEVSRLKVVAGQGVEGVLSFEEKSEDLELTLGRLGRPRYVLGEDYGHFKKITDEAASRGETVSLLEIADDRYILRLKDEVRSTSRQLIGDLKQSGHKISVLTGDGIGAATHVSEAVGGGIHVISGATPEEKLNYVRALQTRLEKKNGGVLMVGDGVNDGAALAASLVGMACGLHSATAVHAADVVLVQEELSNVDWFLRKAKATQAIVRQNLIIALGLMFLSAFACIWGAVPLWLAVTLHEGGTILVGINGLRLLREN